MTFKEFKSIPFVKGVSWILLLGFGAILTLSSIRYKKSSYTSGLYIVIDNASPQSLITEADIHETLMSFNPEMVSEVALEVLNLNFLEHYLEMNPYVESSNVYLDAQNGLHINVVQRKPIIRVEDPYEAGYYLDSKGVQMPLSKHYSVRLPIVTGRLDPYIEEFLDYDDHNLRYVFEMARLIEGDDFMANLVEQIHFSGENELTIVPKVGPNQIVWGESGIRNEKKLKKLKAFYKEALSKKGWMLYSTINLKFKDQIVCTRRG